MADCPNPLRCIICTKAGIVSPKAAHVTASLACPVNKQTGFHSKGRPRAEA